MRPSPLRHNLARLRTYLNLGQKQMADLAGCSTRAIQSVELGTLALSEDLARRIASATGVHLRWLLENDLEADIIGSGGHLFTNSDFDCVQANKKIGSSEFMQFMIEDYAASFYGQIRALLSSAVKRDLAEVAVWKLAKFLDDSRAEFGHDRRLMPGEEQFGLRAEDSPYLKFRQIEAGIALFRKYDKGKKTIRKAVAALQKSKAKKRRRSPKKT